MQLENSASEKITVEITNTTTGAVAFRDSLSNGSTKAVSLSGDYTYNVAASAIDQSPANHNDTSANAHVRLAISNGQVKIYIGAPSK
ncbi:hypothetical protein [Nostoc sp.]|uniref:hypothetical protein n=1 Tax=Nostoc sp. TaxID=1180 RepID=UPI002FF69FDE